MKRLLLIALYCLSASSLHAMETHTIEIHKGAAIDQDALDLELIEKAKSGSLEELNNLIEKGADIDKQDNYDRTALIWACYNGQEEVAKLLIEKGA